MHDESIMVQAHRYVCGIDCQLSGTLEAWSVPGHVNRTIGLGQC